MIFVCLEGRLDTFSVPGGLKKFLGCGLLVGISTKADTMTLNEPTANDRGKAIVQSIANIS